jgi:hypothetical protein
MEAETSNRKCDHDDNRKKVCAACGRKISFGKKNPSKFLVNDRVQKLLQIFSNKDFTISSANFPLSICSSCRNALTEREKNDFKRPLPKMPNFEEILLSKETRASNSQCNCYICLTGRYTGHAKVDTGRGHVRDEVIKIDANNGLYGSSSMSSLPSKVTVPTAEFRIPKLELCKNCLQEIGKGKRHSCSNKAAPGNVANTVKYLPEKQQEQVITTLLKNNIKLKTTSMEQSSSTCQNVELNLSTKGRTARLVMNPSQQKQVVFPVESLDNYQVNSGASSSQMEKLTNFLRVNAGKQSVPAYYKEHVSEKAKTLQNLYKNYICEFDVEDKKEKENRTVVWADAEELLEAVLQERKETGSSVIKVMADGGQGFFKICMTVLPENYSPELDRGVDGTELDSESEEEMEASNSPKSKRSLYSEGGSVGRKGKLTGVHRLIMLCIVPQIKESYENLDLLFKLTKINNISFKFVSDFKVLLLVNGQQTATSSYPSPYCFVTLRSLRGSDEKRLDDHDDIDETDETTSASVANDMNTSRECVGLKTYGDLRKSHAKFCSLGSNKKFAKDCESTINPPLFAEQDDVYVAEKCVIPELHILQGYVNHLFWNGLVPLLGRDRALLWPKKLKLIPKNYHGEIFEGNPCRKLLKEADHLNDPEVLGDVSPICIVPFISAFKAMNKVVHDCFSARQVSSELDKDIEELKKAFKATGVSETLKVHMLLHHVKHSLHFLGKRGLGLWSEQAGESIHREFLKYWERHKINMIDDPGYGTRLQKAVVEFSSRHI